MKKVRLCLDCEICGSSYVVEVCEVDAPVYIEAKGCCSEDCVAVRNARWEDHPGECWDDGE